MTLANLYEINKEEFGYLLYNSPKFSQYSHYTQFIYFVKLPDLTCVSSKVSVWLRRSVATLRFRQGEWRGIFCFGFRRKAKPCTVPS